MIIILPQKWFDVPSNQTKSFDSETAIVKMFHLLVIKSVKLC